MLATDTEVELGRLHSPKGATAGPRHRLLHLDGTVVLPYCRARENRWHCTVVGSRVPRLPGHVTLTEAQLAFASTTVSIDPGRDPDGWARLLWLSRVFCRWPGGPMFALAQLLAEHLRPAGALHVPVNVLGDRTSIAAWLPTTRPPGADRLIERLILTGFLTRTAPERWSLTVPPEDRP